MDLGGFFVVEFGVFEYEVHVAHKGADFGVKVLVKAFLVKVLCVKRRKMTKNDSKMIQKDIKMTKNDIKMTLK